MKHFAPSAIERAVVAVCPEIIVRQPTPATRLPEECELWREFACCVLSSQVPFELAEAAAAEIVRVGALDVAATGSQVSALRDVLQRPLEVEGRRRRYRFHETKSRQLAASCCAVREAAGSLGALLTGFLRPEDARVWLVQHAPGMGPKQASMFLRNVGLSQDLAVLDRHVLEYMATQDLCDGDLRFVSRMSDYLQLEARLRRHALRLGHSMGDLDRAIWVVMRVARRREDVGGRP